MTVGRLTETFARLLRENHAHAAALTPDAERAIRRRVAARWAGGIGAMVVVGATVTATVVGAYGGGNDSDSATRGPIPTPTIGVAVATFPVTGGPEFVSAAAGLRCGDPVPKSHPKEHDVGIALTQTNAASPGATIQTPDEMPSVIARLSQTVGTELGVVADSGISLIIARDGVVAGVIEYGAPEVGWNARGVGASYEGQYGAQLVASWISCPGDDTSKEPDLEPGVYDVVGITRVFSTPESVALYQTLGFSNSGWNLDPTHLDPQGIYLPGSYDCAQTVDQQSPARSCLPDFTPDAKFDAAASTVTMLYDTKDLVEEFSTVLVSDPVSVFIPGKESLSWMDAFDWESLGTFDSVDDLTCGASAQNISMVNESSDLVSLSLNRASADGMRAGGDFSATAWATGVPDGSSVELLPGARIVYLENATIDVPESNVSVGVQNVVASAAISAGQPVATDRFAGPQPLPVTVEPWLICPGVDETTITWSTSAVLVGQWRIVTPDGTVTTLNAGEYLNVY